MVTTDLSAEVREALGKFLVAPEELFELLATEKCSVCCYAGGGGWADRGARAQ